MSVIERLNELAALADLADHDYFASLDMEMCCVIQRAPAPDSTTKPFIAACSPESILELIQAYRSLEAKVNEARDAWRPIGEYRDEMGVVLLGLHVIHRDLTTEWLQYLGYQDDDDGAARDPEYNELLPWVWDDFTHFCLVAPSPAKEG